MIKAETIAHEGTPAPNWIDKCRSAITPISTILGLLAVVIIIGALVAASHKSAIQANETHASQPATTNAVSPLKVTNLDNAGQTSSANVPANQTTSNNGSSTNAATNDASSATSVGPAPTSSLSQLQSAASSNIAPLQASQQIQNAVTGLTKNLPANF